MSYVNTPVSTWRWWGILCRYRKWDLGNGIELVCRCEHDAATYGPNGELQLMNIKALNEWDSRVCCTLL